MLVSRSDIAVFMEEFAEENKLLTAKNADIEFPPLQTGRI